jgi:hypothetical protein
MADKKEHAGQRRLDLDGASDRCQRRGEFYQGAVARGLDLAAVVHRQLAADELPVFLDQAQREGFVALAERGEADHVGEHDSGRAALSSEWIVGGHSVVT